VPAPLPQRDRIIILFSLTAIIVLAWVYLIHLGREMSSSMASMDAMAQMGMTMDQTWTGGDVVLTFVMWTVMMIGMMTGSAIPAVLIMANGRAARGERHVSPITLLFAIGYLLIWIVFSALAAVGQWALHSAALLSPAMKTSSPWLAGAVLIVAGLYQWTPIKQACLAHCQNPLNFLMMHWRSGWSGALAMGVRHGAYCVGCCWALMVVLFVIGVMNLVGVALLALLVLVEKITPAGRLVSRVAGAALVVAGIVAIVNA